MNSDVCWTIAWITCAHVSHAFVTSAVCRISNHVRPCFLLTPMPNEYIFPGRGGVCESAALHCDWMRCVADVNGCQIYTLRRRSRWRRFFVFTEQLRRVKHGVKGRSTGVPTGSMCHKWARLSDKEYFANRKVWDYLFKNNLAILHDNVLASKNRVPETSTSTVS